MRAARESWGYRILTFVATLSLIWFLPNGRAFGSSTGGPQLGNCDPYRAEIHLAQARIGQRDIDGAMKILGKLLSGDKNNIMGNYLVGVIDLTKPGAASRRRGFQQVQLAASLIPTRPESCARELGWYSIYITAGALYYDRGDRADARKYLGMAYDHRASLLRQALQVLFEDLGRLAFSEGDLSAALSYFYRAQKEGSKTAGASIAIVKNLQNTASGTKPDTPP